MRKLRYGNASNENFGTKNALAEYVMGSNVNLQAQATNQASMGALGDAGSVRTEKQVGKFEGLTVIVNDAVNNSTDDFETKKTISDMQNEIKAENVDDEGMSNKKSEDNTQKALKDKTKDAEKKEKINATQSVSDPQKSDEQQQQGKRITKQTQARLTIINQGTEEFLKDTIGERSNRLFSGSEEKYKELFQEFDKLSLEQKLDTSKLQKNLQDKFPDIAEQHNALEIILNVWERKLARFVADELNNKSKTSSEKDKDEADVNKQTQQKLNKHAQQLKENIDALKEVQTNLYANNSSRIDDSYKLAPLLREVTANLVHDIALPPKSFNEIILDKVLPLNGDPVKTFECLCENFIETDKTAKNIGESISCFENNLFVIKECLKHELKTCPDAKVAFAIVNVCRASEKLEALNNENIMVVRLTANSFAKTSNNHD